MARHWVGSYWTEIKLEQLHSVKEFIVAHGISRAQFYRLVKEGRGPKITKIGRRTLVSEEAAAEWRRGLERQGEASHGR